MNNQEKVSNNKFENNYLENSKLILRILKEENKKNSENKKNEDKER